MNCTDSSGHSWNLKCIAKWSHPYEASPYTCTVVSPTRSTSLRYCTMVSPTRSTSLCYCTVVSPARSTSLRYCTHVISMLLHCGLTRMKHLSTLLHYSAALTTYLPHIRCTSGCVKVQDFRCCSEILRNGTCHSG